MTFPFTARAARLSAIPAAALFAAALPAAAQTYNANSAYATQGVQYPSSGYTYGTRGAESGSAGGYGTGYTGTSGGAGVTYGGSPAKMQGSGTGPYTIEGRVEYEALMNSAHDDHILYGNVTLGYMPGQFGFDLGVEGYDADDASNLAVYGTVKMDMGLGVVSAGVPRSAMDTFLDVPALGGSQYLDRATGLLTRGFVGNQYLETGKIPVGLRFDSQLGNATFATSASRFHDGVTAIDATVNYATGPVTLSGGAQHVDGDDVHSGLGYVIGGAVQANDQLKGGLYYSKLREPDNIEGWTLYSTWEPMQKLALTGEFIKARAGEDDTHLYGVSAEYTVWEGAYLQGGFLDGDDTRATYDVSVGWKF